MCAAEFVVKSGRALTLALSLGVAGFAPALAEPDPRPPVSVDVLQVRMQGGALVEEAYPGLVTAHRESRLGFETGGRVAFVGVDIGDRVEEGAELARLDLRSLEAEITAADASVREAEASLRLARATAERQSELIAEGHVSRQRLDETGANVDAAAARLGAAQARLDALNVRRDLAILSAPFAGVITERHLDEGAIAAPGEPVVDLVETDAVEIRLGLPLEHAERLTAGELYAFAVGDRQVQARLRRSSGVVDRATQTVTVIFDVAADAPAPGQVARLKLQNHVEQSGFWAPLTALSQGRRGLWTVFALEPEEGSAAPGVHRLTSRVVDVLHVEADRAFLRGAARDGDLIVAAGVERVVPNQRVIPASTPIDVSDRLAHVGAR